MTSVSNVNDESIGRLGKDGLIEKLTAGLRNENESTLTGIGDDAAVLDFTGYRTVVSTAILMEGVHFNLIYTPLRHLGYKLAVSGFSNINAMNAKPQQIFISLAFSAKHSLQMLEEFYDGIKQACINYGVDLAGGDTSSSYTGMAVSCTVTGRVEDSRIVFRKGAKINDLICVSGDLGAAYAGLQVLERERKMFSEHPNTQPSLDGYEYVLERQLKPEARQDIINSFEELEFIPSSMTDITEGLTSGLKRICNASGKTCRIYADKIPIHSETKRVAEEFNMEPLIAALNGGEDFELLFTVPPLHYDKIQSIPGIRIIGHITEEHAGSYLITGSGEDIELGF